MTNKRFYVYAIYVDEAVRYIGKGSNGRMYFHVIEAQRINGRRARGAKTDRTSTKFYRKLAEAMRRGAAIREEIRRQLWNTIDERMLGTTWKEYKRRRQFLLARSSREMRVP